MATERVDKGWQQRGIAVDYRLHAGYDHGYYFITTFVEDHIAHHARALHR